ncbi:MAG: 3-isopropylmalate dehydratase small subunit, partial [SAR324 cluster bacterium]|nr:3-isopropylmalate dehydratase small subunit [SAR324 cluster bacterium]
EHAVWALLAGGIKVVIAGSFADIFYSNSAKNGLFLISLPKKDLLEIIEKVSEENLELIVDLPSQIVQLPKVSSYSFEVDAFRKYCFMEGVDELDYILSEKEKLKTYWASVERRSFLNGS